MSNTKNLLEQISVEMGYGGEINEEVIAYAKTIEYSNNLKQIPQHTDNTKQKQLNLDLEEDSL